MEDNEIDPRVPGGPGSPALLTVSTVEPGPGRGHGAHVDLGRRPVGEPAARDRELLQAGDVFRECPGSASPGRRPSAPGRRARRRRSRRSPGRCREAAWSSRPCAGSRRRRAAATPRRRRPSLGSPPGEATVPAAWTCPATSAASSEAAASTRSRRRPRGRSAIAFSLSTRPAAPARRRTAAIASESFRSPSARLNAGKCPGGRCGHLGRQAGSEQRAIEEEGARQRHRPAPGLRNLEVDLRANAQAERVARDGDEGRARPPRPRPRGR